MSYTCPLCNSSLETKKERSNFIFLCKDCGFRSRAPVGYSLEDGYKWITKNRPKTTKTQIKGFKSRSRTKKFKDTSFKLKEDTVIQKKSEKMRSINRQTLPKVLNHLLDDKTYYPVYLEKLEKSLPKAGSTVEEFISITGLQNKLKNKGIQKLYRYQEETYKKILNGQDIIVSAPTGMGKTESFLLPIIYSILRIEPNPIRRNTVSAIFIYPTKALAADQRDKVEYYCKGLGIRVGVYDGDTERDVREKMYRKPPDILITNADMIHYHLSGNIQFQILISKLRFLVLDEIHLCVGSFGTNVLWIIRRLKRFTPGLQCIGASATIANAKNFGEMIFDSQVKLISAGNARKSDLYLSMLYPKESSNLSLMARVTSQFIRNGNKTLVFGNGHKSSEVLNLILKQRGVNSEIHRAGLSMNHRKRVENKFRNNEIDALVSTPTLELGIDIGNLDSVVSQLTNLTSFIQRIGRAGRKGQESFATLVLNGDDPISAYYARKPEDYLSDIQPAHVEPNNDLIGRYQIIAMLLDKPMDKKDITRYNHLLTVLEKEKLIILGEEKVRIINRSKMQNILKNFSIRGIGNNIQIRNNNSYLGDRSLPIALRELHVGAIYLHGGSTYKVNSLDVRARQAKVLRIPPEGQKTQAMRSIQPQILEVQQEANIDGLSAATIKLQLTETVDGYIKTDIFSNKILGKFDLDEPISYTFDTMGFVVSLPIPEDYVSPLNAKGREEVLGGTFHAIEHVLIESGNSITGGGASQIGGISMGDTGLVFIYDGSEGGSGLSKLLFNDLEKGLLRSRNIMEMCPCKQVDGCPRCTYSYQCGNNNQPLNRIGAIESLNELGKQDTFVDYDFIPGTSYI